MSNLFFWAMHGLLNILRQKNFIEFDQKYLLPKKKRYFVIFLIIETEKKNYFCQDWKQKLPFQRRFDPQTMGLLKSFFLVEFYSIYSQKVGFASQRKIFQFWNFSINTWSALMTNFMIEKFRWPEKQRSFIQKNQKSQKKFFFNGLHGRQYSHHLLPIIFPILIFTSFLFETRELVERKNETFWFIVRNLISKILQILKKILIEDDNFCQDFKENQWSSTFYFKKVLALCLKKRISVRFSYFSYVVLLASKDLFKMIFMTFQMIYWDMLIVARVHRFSKEKICFIFIRSVLHIILLHFWEFLFAYKMKFHFQGKFCFGCLFHPWNFIIFSSYSIALLSFIFEKKN